MATTVHIGTAGWSIPRASAAAFPLDKAGLQRYAARLNCAEINSSFYRPHRRSTWERWAATVSDGFKFAVKAPRTLTHERRLSDPAEPLAAFLEEIALLGDRLGPVLLQLPPSLIFDASAARAFFEHWRGMFDGQTVIEPRHASWFDGEPDALLSGFRIARVAADPAVRPETAHPGGWPGLRYWRLHGSPRMYSSSYDEAALDRLATEIAGGDTPAWCVFDNTMHGAAIENALRVRALLGR